MRSEPEMNRTAVTLISKARIAVASDEATSQHAYRSDVDVAFTFCGQARECGERPSRPVPA